MVCFSLTRSLSVQIAYAGRWEQSSLTKTIVSFRLDITALILVGLVVLLANVHAVSLTLFLALLMTLALAVAIPYTLRVTRRCTQTENS